MSDLKFCLMPAVSASAVHNGYRRKLYKGY